MIDHLYSGWPPFLCSHLCSYRSAVPLNRWTDQTRGYSAVLFEQCSPGATAVDCGLRLGLFVFQATGNYRAFCVCVCKRWTGTRKLENTSPYPTYTLWSQSLRGKNETKFCRNFRTSICIYHWYLMFTLCIDINVHTKCIIRHFILCGCGCNNFLCENN